MGTPYESADRDFEPAISFSRTPGQLLRAGIFAGLVMPTVLAVKGINAIARSETAKSVVGIVGHISRAALEVGAAPLRYASRPHGADAKYVADLTARYAGKDLQAAKDGVLDIAQNMKGGVANILQSFGDVLRINGPKDAHN